MAAVGIELSDESALGFLSYLERNSVTPVNLFFSVSVLLLIFNAPKLYRIFIQGYEIRRKYDLLDKKHETKSKSIEQKREKRLRNASDQTRGLK